MPETNTWETVSESITTNVIEQKLPSKNQTSMNISSLFQKWLKFETHFDVYTGMNNSPGKF